MQDDGLVQALDQLTAVQTVLASKSQPQPIETSNDDLQLSSGTITTKQWPCGVCQRVFSRSALLRTHLRKHTGNILHM